MIKIEFKGDVSFLAKMRGRPPRILQMLMGRLNQLMSQLSAYIVSQKLSGQVLKRQTGRLAASVHPVFAKREAGVLVAGVESSAPPAFYGHVHEYGGSHAYAIVATKARALAFMMDGRKVFAQSVSHPPAKVRAFMGPSFEENKARIEAELLNALNEGIRE